MGLTTDFMDLRRLARAAGLTKYPTCPTCGEQVPLVVWDDHAASCGTNKGEQ